MHIASRRVLTWIGRLALLTVPVVIIGGFVRPDAIQILNPVVCDEGLELSIQARDPGTPFDNRPVCDSEKRMVDADERLFAAAAGALVLAVLAYTVRSHLTPRSLSAPVTPRQV